MSYVFLVIDVWHTRKNKCLLRVREEKSQFFGFGRIIAVDKLKSKQTNLCVEYEVEEGKNHDESYNWVSFLIGLMTDGRATALQRAFFSLLLPCRKALLRIPASIPLNPPPCEPLECDWCRWPKPLRRDFDGGPAWINHQSIFHLKFETELKNCAARWPSSCCFDVFWVRKFAEFCILTS